jgi:cobalt-zinc-cadmium efflux system membrane fusion protein
MKNISDILSNSMYFKSLLLVAILALASCNSKGKSEVTNTDTTETTEDTDVITITENQFVAGNMTVGKIKRQLFNTIVKANGMFAVPPENQSDVSTYFEGYVKNISLLPGDPVRKGQTLFTIENPAYVDVQQEFLKAKGRLNYLKSDYERQKELNEDKITSEKKLLKAESEYKVTLAQFHSLKKRLSLMNINPNNLTAENIQSVISVTSPLTGYATTINATKGAFLNPSDVAVTVTNTNDLHIELKIFEKDFSMVKKGDFINVKLQNNPKVYQGKVHLINKTISNQDRTIAIHGDLVYENDIKLFAPGMYIEGEIVTTSQEHLALPVDAVAKIDNNFFVLKKENETHFKRVLVKIGATNNDFIEIVNANDFKEGTEFITKGVFNLITE